MARSDPKFGTGRLVTLPIGSDVLSATLAIQPDGMLVVAGDYLDTSDNEGTYVIRLAPDGSPDPSFGATGYATFSGVDAAWGVALQPDGKILLNGSFGIMRLNANGSEDTSWGGTGVVTSSL